MSVAEPVGSSLPVIDPAGSIKSRRMGEPRPLTPSSLTSPCSTGVCPYVWNVECTKRSVLTLRRYQHTVNLKTDSAKRAETDFRIRTVTSLQHPVSCTLTNPSLFCQHRLSQRQHIRSRTHSTANGPTPLAILPQFPVKSSSVPSIGTVRCQRHVSVSSQP